MAIISNFKSNVLLRATAYGVARTALSGRRLSKESSFGDTDYVLLFKHPGHLSQKSRKFISNETARKWFLS